MSSVRDDGDNPIAEATKWLCKAAGIKYPSHLATALGKTASWGQRRAQGRKPYPDGLALLFLASDRHEAFRPQSQGERDALQKLEESPSEELTKFREQYGERVQAAQQERRQPSGQGADGETSDLRVIRSPLADAIVAGTADIAGQVTDANRFALTRDNFATIGTTFTAAEIEDTARLSRELARRLRILLQLSESNRMKVIRELGVPLNTLLGVITAQKELTPKAMINTMAALTGTPHDKEQEGDES